MIIFAHIYMYTVCYAVSAVYVVNVVHAIYTIFAVYIYIHHLLISHLLASLNPIASSPGVLGTTTSLVLGVDSESFSVSSTAVIAHGATGTESGGSPGWPRGAQGPGGPSHGESG